MKKKKYSVHGVMSAVTQSEEIEAESEEEAEKIYREMWISDKISMDDWELDVVYVEEVQE